MSPLLDVRDLSKRFPLRRDRREIHAVESVSFTIEPGECVGLVGESGCGKSTLARLLARLIDPTEGRIWFNGRYLDSIPASIFASTPERAAIQMVFQDPGESLNPRFTAFDAIAEPLRRLSGLKGREALSQRVHELAELVGLPRELLGRFPHQLSGGQQQRVAIARAISVSPKLLILDEPTSSLDVSVQAVILQLLADLKARLQMTYLFVSHDLNLVRLVADRVLVMYLGTIVERGPASRIFDQPLHPYTRALVSAIPMLDLGAKRKRIVLAGDPPSPIDPPPHACRFQGRCPDAIDHCGWERPVLLPVDGSRDAACHLINR